MSNFPNRCQHIKVNGTLCGSPALRRNRLCYFHKLHHEEMIELNLGRAKDARARRRKVSIVLPVLEDANSIQVSLMQIMRLILTGDLDGKSAGLLLYALQTASSNLPRTRFEPYRHDVVLDVKALDETPLGAHIWEDADFEEDDDEEEDEAENATADDPRPNFTPAKPGEARNKAELNRWASAEADRLAIIGAAQRRAEDLAEGREDELYERSVEAAATARQNAEDEAALQLINNLAAKLPLPAPTVTPAGTAVLPSKTQAPPEKRPPAKQSLDEVRKKVTAQIREALPAIAAAVKANGGHIG
jgi:hypothetical protein